MKSEKVMNLPLSQLISGNLKSRILEEKVPDFVSRVGTKSWKKSGVDWKGLTLKWVSNTGNLRM